MRQGFINEDDVFFDNVYILRNKIKAGATISFKMAVYVVGIRPQLQLSEEEIVAKPLEMIMIDGEYYVIAYVPKIDSLQHYRVNRMRDIEKEGDITVDDARINWKTIDEYRWEHGLMRDDKKTMATVRVPVQHVDLVMDRFRDAAFPRDWNDGNYVRLQFHTNLIELYTWAMENSESVEVLEPQKVRNRLRHVAASMHTQYSKTSIDEYYKSIERCKAKEHSSYHFFCSEVDLRQRREWLHLTHLRSMMFRQSNISDVCFVMDFPHLTYLKIAEEHLRDITPLKNADCLRALSLERTDVSNITPLIGTSIRWLELVDNHCIEDYSALYDMTAVETLVLDDAALTRVDVDELLKVNPNLKICKPGDLEARFPGMQF